MGAIGHASQPRTVHVLRRALLPPMRARQDGRLTARSLRSRRRCLKEWGSVGQNVRYQKCHDIVERLDLGFLATMGSIQGHFDFRVETLNCALPWLGPRHLPGPVPGVVQGSPATPTALRAHHLQLDSCPLSPWFLAHLISSSPQEPSSIKSLRTWFLSLSPPLSSFALLFPPSYCVDHKSSRIEDF